MSFAPSTQYGLMHANTGPNEKHPATTTHHPLSHVDVHSSRRYELVTHDMGTDESRRRGRETLSPKPRLSRTAIEPLSFTFSLSFPLSYTLPLNPSPPVFLLLPFFLSSLPVLGLPSWLTQAPNSHSSSLSFRVFLPSSPYSVFLPILSLTLVSLFPSCLLSHLPSYALLLSVQPCFPLSVPSSSSPSFLHSLESSSLSLIVFLSCFLLPVLFLLPRLLLSLTHFHSCEAKHGTKEREANPTSRLIVSSLTL